MKKIERSSNFGAERYTYDFKICTYANGWAQLDTDQDASYFGTWANPLTFELMSYCEGDTTHTKCETEQEFIHKMAELIAWNQERGYFIGVDGMCRDNIIQAFTRMGFGDALH